MSDQSEVNDKRSGSADLLRSLNGRVIDLDNDLLQIKKKVTEVEVLCRLVPPWVGALLWWFENSK